MGVQSPVRGTGPLLLLGLLQSSPASAHSYFPSAHTPLPMSVHTHVHPRCLVEVHSTWVFDSLGPPLLARISPSFFLFSCSLSLVVSRLIFFLFPFSHRRCITIVFLFFPSTSFLLCFVAHHRLRRVAIPSSILSFDHFRAVLHYIKHTLLDLLAHARRAKSRSLSYSHALPSKASDDLPSLCANDNIVLPFCIPAFHGKISLLSQFDNLSYIRNTARVDLSNCPNRSEYHCKSAHLTILQSTSLTNRPRLSRPFAQLRITRFRRPVF